MRIVIDVNQDPVAWDDYVSSHAAATQYHRYGWLEVLQKTFNHRVIPLVASAGARYVGVLPLALMDSWLFGRFLVSLPCVNYAGILADTVDVEQALWKRAAALAYEHQVAYLEVRHLRPHEFVPLRRQHKVTMILDLARTVEDQWKKFDAKLRNQIRKAERSELTVRVGGTAEIHDFFDVFARNMRDLGTPVYPCRFFEEVLKAFPDRTRIFLVQHRQTTVASAVAMADRATLEVPWAASRRDYRAMCPNNLLYWELIQYAIKQGFRRFDFGRSTPGDGPYKFKEQWGGRPVPLNWEYAVPNGSGGIPDVSPRNSKYQLAIAVWKRLPLLLTRWLGPAIVRGIP